MTENYDLEIKQINKEDNELEQTPLDVDRRTMIKKAAFAIGTVYIAPATLNLLLADKASAGSGAPPVDGNPEEMGPP